MTIPKMKNILSLITLFFSFTIIALPASAEYCKMVGGENNIVWINIPRSQVTMLNTTKINLKGKMYTLDRSKRIFYEDGLPEVNTIVTLNDNIASTQIPSCLILQNCSESEKDRLKLIEKVDKYDPLVYINEKAEINTSSYQCTTVSGKNGCWDLNKNTKVKILNYTSINDLLFALVRVVSCK
jgi:hypothetical protein